MCFGQGRYTDLLQLEVDQMVGRCEAQTFHSSFACDSHHHQFNNLLVDDLLQSAIRRGRQQAAAAGVGRTRMM